MLPLFNKNVQSITFVYESNFINKYLTIVFSDVIQFCNTSFYSCLNVVIIK